MTTHTRPALVVPVDQVIRREKYEAAHPETKITCIRPSWQAVVTLPDGAEQVITRYELKNLLDDLEDPPAGNTP